MTFYDLDDRPVLHLDRACCRCDCCCAVACCCCQNEVVLRDARGNVVGYARQRFHLFHLKMEVTDAEDNVFCRIKGPCCPCRCCTEINFDIVSKKGDRPLGYIFKRFGGFRDTPNMDHENVQLYYPKGLKAAQKASLLAATFLVNFMYFEMS